MEPLFQAEGVSKVHNAGRPDELTALTGVSLAIRRGEALVLRGPSGSGKTTLLALLACVARPTAGRVFFAGREVSKLPERFLGANTVLGQFLDPVAQVPLQFSYVSFFHGLVGGQSQFPFLDCFFQIKHVSPQFRKKEAGGRRQEE